MNLCLKSPWPNNLLSYHETEIPDRNRDFTGRSYYVSINLRRVSDLDGQGSNPVLEIKVPYYYKKDNGTLGLEYAKFDSIPTVNPGSFINPNHYGRLWKLDAATGTVDKITITKNNLNK